MQNIQDLANQFGDHLAEKIQHIDGCNNELTVQLHLLTDANEKTKYLGHLKDHIESLYIKHLQICFTPLTCEENQSYETTLGVIRKAYLSIIDKQNTFNMYERPAINFFTKQKYLDGLSFIMERIKNVKESIVLVDHYVDEKTLSFFTSKSPHIELVIKTMDKSMNDSLESAAKLYNKEMGKLRINITAAFTDRFIILDNTEFYIINQSIRDASHESPLYITEINDFEVKDLLRKKLV